MMQATRIGGHARRYLTRRPRDGRVVASFRGGFCLQFDENDPGFVTVHNRAIPAQPWGIQCSDALRTPADGTIVHCRDAVLRFGGQDVLSFDRAEEMPLQPARWTRQDAQQARRALPTVRARLATESRDGDALAIAARLVNANGAERALVEHLVGRGEGSTPAGDDFLVGVVAVLTAAQGTSSSADRRLAALRALLRDRPLPRLTPLPSAQMLMAAGDGSFVEPVLVLLAALPVGHVEALDRAVRRLFGLGATSGAAMARGLVAQLAQCDGLE